MALTEKHIKKAKNISKGLAIGFVKSVVWSGAGIGGAILFSGIASAITTSSSVVTAAAGIGYVAGSGSAIILTETDQKELNSLLGIVE